MSLLEELNKTKNKIGLVSGILKLNEYDDMEQNITAHIDPRTWNIELNIKKGFNPIRDKRQRAYARVKKLDDGKKVVLEDSLYHELAHWELPFSSELGCPYDVYNHDLILEAVKETLSDNKKDHADYVTNAFEDLMINPRCKEFKGDFPGQVLFWDDQGLLLKEKGLKNYTPFYEAFVRLNMHLFGDNKDKALLKRHYSDNKNVGKSVKNIIEHLNLDEAIKDTKILFVKENWPEMASRFTKDLEDLLEVAPIERPSMCSDDKNKGNGVAQKLFTKEGKEEIAYGRYKNSKKLSTNIQSYEQLDSLYRRLARAIPIKVEAMTREQSLRIAPLNYKPFDEEKDDIRKIKPTKLYFTENGLTFGVEKEPLCVVERSKIQSRSFPDFKMIVLDNSDSMKQGINGNMGNTSTIPWGDNSKYHYALLGFYGVEQFLEMQGIAQYIRHGLSLFSSSTRYKESNFRDVQELRKLALSPKFGNTYIDANILVEALDGKESFVLSISDGEIANWSNVKDKFERLAKENYFAHVQIGSKNKFTNDLENINLPVFYVNSGEELSRLMVNITTNTYKRFVRR